MRKSLAEIIARVRQRFIGVVVSATGVSLVIHALAFFRQILIAALFGVSRDFDVYVMVFSLATFLVFTFSGIFESIAVPHLVRRREAEGEEGARLLAIAILRVSFVIGVAASLLLLLAAPLLAPIMATGFSPEERAEVTRLAWYFLPWTLISLPYYAAAASLKANWRFTQVFSADIAVVVISIGVLAIRHDDIYALPLAYAAGYGGGFVLLALGAGLWRRGRGTPLPAVRDVTRNIGELYLANQIGSVSGLIDRHIQSFVPPGGVAAVNYSSQLTISLASLLTFRELFAVPLSQKADRAQRLERLIIGVILLAVPLSGLVFCFAPDIVSVLFQRGRFDASATALTTDVLRVAAFSIIAGVVHTPLARMFQIVDRIRFTQVMYVWIALSTLIFGYLFVVGLGWGVQGVASAQLATSVTTCLLTAHLVSRCGIELHWWLVLRYMLFAGAVAVAAYLIAGIAASRMEGALGRLVVGGSAYGLTVLVVYAFARSHLSRIVFGLERAEVGPR